MDKLTKERLKAIRSEFNLKFKIIDEYHDQIDSKMTDILDGVSIFIDFVILIVDHLLYYYLFILIIL